MTVFDLVDTITVLFRGIAETIAFKRARFGITSRVRPSPLNSYGA